MSTNVQNILISVFQLIVALFGAFGSFLLKILPIQIDNQEFIYASVQFLCVILFLLVKFILLKNKSQRFWHWVIGISFVLFLSTGVAYHLHSNNTLRMVGRSDFRAVNGDLSQKSLNICNSDFYKSNPNFSAMDCERGILYQATTQDLYWIYTPESVEKNLKIFTILYVLFAVSLSITIFSLLELIVAKSVNTNETI